MTPAKKRPTGNAYYPPFALRAPYYGEDTIEDMPDGMSGFRMVTVYGYYDMPLMYTIENGEEIYFCYWLDTDEKRGVHVMSYQRITRDDQTSLEAGDMCLRSMLASRPALVVERDMTKENWPVKSFRRDVRLQDDRTLLPKEGLSVTIFEAEQICDTVALYYRVDGNMTPETIHRAAGEAVNSLWERLFMPDERTGECRISGEMYALYKHWYHTSVAYSADSDSIVNTPNITLIPVVGEDAIRGVEKCAGQFSGMDTAMIEVDDAPLCVATLRTSVTNNRPQPQRRTHTCHGETLPTSMDIALPHDAFSAVLFKSMTEFYQSLAITFDGQGHCLVLTPR